MNGSKLATATPADGEQALALGYDHLYAGRPVEAANAFHIAAFLDPGRAEIWFVLGETLGEGTGAVAALRRAVRVDPAPWGPRVTLAEALVAHDPDAALVIFRDLALERSDSAVARRGCGRALAALGRDGEALEEFREALVLDPRDGETVLNVAERLIASDDGLGAIELLEPRLFDEGDEDARFPIMAARAWIALAEPDKARRQIDAALALDGENAEARALLAGLVGDAGAGMTNAYVRALFDRYADRFDRDLVGKLGYVAPALLRDAVDRVRGNETGGLRLMDLGCGSGLAGVVFRPLAGHLAGVDLSPRMVDKARERGVYDALGVGDVVAALDTGEHWDLAVAADVLVYLGDLAPLFAALAKALPSGGLFAATTERLEDGAEPFRLRETRRYAHADDYVKNSAAAAGFVPRLIEACAPRRERGVPVAGTLHVYERR